MNHWGQRKQLTCIGSPTLRPNLGWSKGTCLYDVTAIAEASKWKPVKSRETAYYHFPQADFGQHGRLGRVLQAPLAAPATTLVSILPTEAEQVGSHDPDTLPYLSPSPMVAPGGKCGVRFVLSTKPTVRHHNDRRFIDGLGGDTTPTTGVWERSFQSLHISLLEMWAVVNALERFKPQISGQHVQIRCDNTTVVAYINHQGGTRSPSLCLLAWNLLHWATGFNIHLSAVHIPGTSNDLADALSRKRIVPTEWSLLPAIAQLLFSWMDRPYVDLFATTANAQWPCTAPGTTPHVLHPELRPPGPSHRCPVDGMGRDTGLRLSPNLPL